MRFLISMVFVGMLALSSQAFAKRFGGSAAQEILRNGDVVAEAFTINGHQTRVWFKGSYYACNSRPSSGAFHRSSDSRVDEEKLTIFCQNIE